MASTIDFFYKLEQINENGNNVELAGGSMCVIITQSRYFTYNTRSISFYYGLFTYYYVTTVQKTKHIVLYTIKMQIHIIFLSVFLLN